MNINLSKDEFHEMMMLYLIRIANDNKGNLKDGENIVYTPEFDDFLRHILSRPLGSLKTAYMREDAKVKLSYKRMVNNMEDAENVRIIV